MFLSTSSSDSKKDGEKKGADEHEEEEGKADKKDDASGGGGGGGGFFSNLKQSLQDEFEKNTELQEELAKVKEEMNKAVGSVKEAADQVAEEVKTKTKASTDKKEGGEGEESGSSETSSSASSSSTASSTSSSSSSSSSSTEDAGFTVDVEEDAKGKGKGAGKAGEESDWGKQRLKEQMDSFGTKARGASKGFEDQEGVKAAREGFSVFSGKVGEALGEGKAALFASAPFLKQGLDKVKEAGEKVEAGDKVKGARKEMEEALQEAKDDLMGVKREKVVEKPVEAEKAADAVVNGWRATLDEDTGDTYYYHEESGETQWEVPEGMTAAEGADPDGPSALVFVKDDSQSTWQRMKQRLERTPLIQDMLNNSRRARENFEKTKAGERLTETGDRVADFTEDIREKWETSQNPWVVEFASAWDGITAETEHGACVSEMRRLDPDWDEHEVRRERRDDNPPSLLWPFINNV
jgi:hypothetical protein